MRVLTQRFSWRFWGQAAVNGNVKPYFDSQTLWKEKMFSGLIPWASSLDAAAVVAVRCSGFWSRGFSSDHGGNSTNDKYSWFESFHRSKLHLFKPKTATRAWTSSSIKLAETKSQATPLSVAKLQQHQQSGERQQNSWYWNSILIFPPVLAGFLGFWQLRRRTWKEKLIKQRVCALASPPQDIFADSTHHPEEYQVVFAHGSFDNEKTQFIGPRPRSVMGATEAGYLAVTPFRDSKSNRTILVQRGWVPERWRRQFQKDVGRGKGGESPIKQSNTKLPTIVEGDIDTIVGIIRRGESQRSTFVPENKPEKGEWYYVDPEGLALALNLPSKTPFVEIISYDKDVGEDVNEMYSPGDKGTPPDVSTHGSKAILKSEDAHAKSMQTTMAVLGGQRNMPEQNTGENTYPLTKDASELLEFKVTTQDHLNYAATWFTLSAATSFLAFRALRRRGI